MYCIVMFLDANDLSQWNLELKQEDKAENMKIWTNTKLNALISRLVDIRWFFNSNAEAIRYHYENMEDNAENCREISIENLRPVGEEFHVFYVGTADPIVKAFGLEMNMYNFLFCKNNVLAKVFISGSPDLALFEAIEVARIAEMRIEQAQEQISRELMQVS